MQGRAGGPQLLDMAVNERTTGARYKTAMRLFNNWHSLHGQAIDATTCDEREMDNALSRYLQYFFENNGSRSSAADTLCAAQHFFPRLKGHLPIGGRALRA